ncbi:MAG: lysine--tRNA ligase [Chlamydiia bacterium]|nr:lysine--tRNA ligase [Chlamydiia bacterium]
MVEEITGNREEPAYFEHEEYVNRKRKLEELRALGVEPYPHHFERTHRVHEVLNIFKDDAVGSSEDALAGKTPKVKVFGRLVLFRAMGKNAFAQIQGETADIQVMFNRDATQVTGFDASACAEGEALTPLKLIEKKIDLGDIIGVEGHLFRTGKGELTVLANESTLLCKTLLPLADKHSGLTDKEVRYRKRWLDLISNPDIKKTFQTRSRILREIREYCEEHSFIEVETPVLQSIYGGAEARPFTTHLNALDQDMFMRISLEIPLKKLIVGGMDRIFEIGRVFRNEGIDRTHNPEFTMLEAYASGWDYNDMMRFVEKLYEHLAISLHGDTKIPYGLDDEGNPVMIDVKSPWKRLTVKQAIEQYQGIQVDKLSDEELKDILIRSGVDADELKGKPRGLLVAAVFEEKVEPHLVQPHHITDYPIETTPLCKLSRDPEQRALAVVERFESYILGGEICNAYSELNDPVLQRELLEEQAAKREAGDEEASPLDEEFLEAICQGMPPTGGVGIGIDRLVMLFTQSSSIRDVLYFPLMRPQG